MHTRRGLNLVTFWFLVFGSVALLVAFDALSSGTGQTETQWRLAMAVLATLTGLISLTAALGLWRRRPWARPLGIGASLILAALHLSVIPALVALDAVIAWFLWRRATADAFRPALAPPGE
jgi:hypothetical protein